MLQCVAVCCDLLLLDGIQPNTYMVIVCCSVLQCVAVCCSVLQCVAVCCSVLQCIALRLGIVRRQSAQHLYSDSVLQDIALCCRVLQCVVTCCSVLQRVAACAVCSTWRWRAAVSVLQFVAVCCSLLQCVAPTSMLCVGQSEYVMINHNIY